MKAPCFYKLTNRKIETMNYLKILLPHQGISFKINQITNKNYLSCLCGGIHSIITLLVLITLFATTIAKAETGRFRAMFGNNPSTDITIGFDAYAPNTNPVLYLSRSPIDVNNLSSYTSQKPDIANSQFEMETRFVKLTGLLPGRTYYFVVKDNFSTSKVYHFETTSNHKDAQLSIIAGGDSRSNIEVRAVANKVVSKLQAHAFAFDGDFTDNGNVHPEQWQQWLDDWQLTISSNNRITPIIPARGNHESNNVMLSYLFDCPENMYYTKSLGGGLLNVYTLNSEITFSGASSQTTWLKNELANSTNTWKFVQYHDPIRPHVAGKLEGAIQYAYWANLFYQYGVDVVLESDAHTVKTTWPLIPCAGGFDCYEGFKRDDSNGTVYIGEGSYAAPLRESDDDKPWTRDSGKFHQFKWLFVNKDQMEIRTVKYDIDTDTDAINELPVNNRFTIPRNLDVWNPPNGSVVTLYKPTSGIPTCTLTIPEDNTMYFNLNNVEIEANASGKSAIRQVQFYVDGALIGTDRSAPYQLNWKPTSNSVYMLSAIAKDVNGLTSAIDFSAINIENENNIVRTSSIDISSDEYYEKTIGSITKTAKIKVSGGAKLQGLRFNGINIPPNATIESANITFRATIGSRTTSSTTFWAEKTTNSIPFRGDKNNLSNRIKTDRLVEWNNMPDWSNCGEYTSVDLSPIIQELVNLPNWTIESPVTFFMSGIGNREAKSSTAPTICAMDNETVKNNSPKLIVRFSISDCPSEIIIKSNTLNGTTLQSIYESSQSIQTEVKQSSPINVAIRANEKVDLKSGNIILNEGFKVEKGGRLNATIDPCD